ncbi:hypothetical protein NDU88_000837 [Pleurodeles waltl]|uniref:Uncharacterized protein n=1 Tax=Pleurodeles waltl TaxID=8319 RepID=A0AAV7VV84_PLEWA|nr:hypothetical protein NDU88_000837 [Pleurodeles waltl]
MGKRKVSARTSSKDTNPTASIVSYLTTAMSALNTEIELVEERLGIARKTPVSSPPPVSKSSNIVTMGEEGGGTRLEASKPKKWSKITSIRKGCVLQDKLNISSGREDDLSIIDKDAIVCVEDTASPPIKWKKSTPGNSSMSKSKASKSNGSKWGNSLVRKPSIAGKKQRVEPVGPQYPEAEHEDKDYMESMLERALKPLVNLLQSIDSSLKHLLEYTKCSPALTPTTEQDTVISPPGPAADIVYIIRAIILDQEDRMS